MSRFYVMLVCLFVALHAHASDLDFSNPANPFELVAQQHNDTLDAMGRYYANHRSESPFFTIHGVQGLSESYCTQRQKATRDACMSRMITFVSEASPYYAVSLEELFARCALEPIQAEYIANMSTQVLRFRTEPVKAIDAIRKLEEQAQKRLLKKQLHPILMVGSIARYSIAYWHDAFVEQPESAWSAYGTLANNTNKICKTCLIDADIRGALVGYTLGGTMGASQMSALFSFLELTYGAERW